MKINAILVDDEKNSRDVLKALLIKFCPEIVITGEASSVKEASLLVAAHKPDLVFLDVQMPMGNGFSLLQQYNPVPFSVIFVTSYDHYALNAIKFSAIDYILKPVEVADLKLAVSKALALKMEVNHYIVHLLNNIDEQTAEKNIPLHVNGKVKFINTSDITHIEADGSYANVFCNKEKLVSSKSLKDFEEFLDQNPHFVRINKSIIINVWYIKEYSKGENFIITLKTGDVFESSRRRKLSVLESLKKLS
jgi:two-component system LytT family response regulator